MAREGRHRSSEELNLSQPTISGQLRELEDALGEKLLERAGRTVALTDIGRTVYRYADEMHNLDRQLIDAVKAPTSLSTRSPPGSAGVSTSASEEADPAAASCRARRWATPPNRPHWRTCCARRRTLGAYLGPRPPARTGQEQGHGSCSSFEA